MTGSNPLGADERVQPARGIILSIVVRLPAVITRSTGGSRSWRQGPVQAGEPGDEADQSDHSEDPQNTAAVGDHQPQPAAFGQRLRCYQHAEPRRITEPGAGHVHHDRRMPHDADGPALMLERRYR
jgi:hypothetical protein